MTVYNITMSKDGDMWSALYGDNLQEGICGFGYTKLDALKEFILDAKNNGWD